MFFGRFFAVSYKFGAYKSSLKQPSYKILLTLIGSHNMLTSDQGSAKLVAQFWINCQQTDIFFENLTLSYNLGAITDA